MLSSSSTPQPSGSTPPEDPQGGGEAPSRVPTVVVVSGPPRAGKTTLALQIAEALSMPLLSREDIRARLLGHLGPSGEADWASRVDVASYAILYEMIESLIAAGVDHVVDSNFDLELDSPCFVDLRELYPYQPVQTICLAAGDELFARTIETTQPPDPTRLREALAKAAYEPLDIGGEVLIVDTTTPETIDLPGLLKRLRETIHTEAPSDRIHGD